jgi:hypothetical protein
MCVSHNFQINGDYYSKWHYPTFYVIRIDVLLSIKNIFMQNRRISQINNLLIKYGHIMLIYLEREWGKNIMLYKNFPNILW